MCHNVSRNIYVAHQNSTYSRICADNGHPGEGQNGQYYNFIQIEVGSHKWLSCST